MYISQRKNTVAQYITRSNILDLCMDTERRPQVQVSKIWWEQAGINFVGTRDAYIGAEWGGGGV